MNKKTLLVILLTGLIADFTGATITSVGQVSAGATYAWTLPVTMFLLLIAPAALGYLIGKEDNNK